MTAPALPVVGERYKRSAGVVWVVKSVGRDLAGEHPAVVFECGGQIQVVSLDQWNRSMRLAENAKESA